MGEVTFREVLASVVIFICFLLVGLPISENLASNDDDYNMELKQAIQIQADPELFQYGMRTEAGNSLSYGTLTSNGNVSCEFFEGEYSSVSVEYQKYCKHIRYVSKTVGTGKDQHTETVSEEYWTWDTVAMDYYCCDSYTFLGIELPRNHVHIIGASSKYDVFSTGFHERAIVTATPTVMEGTAHANLQKTISNMDFYANKTIDSTIEYLTRNSHVWFWVIWILLDIGAVIAFVSYENDWLE